MWGGSGFLEREVKGGGRKKGEGEEGNSRYFWISVVPTIYIYGIRL